jgi:WD40 repeat protein
LLLHMPSPLQFAWSTADGHLLGAARRASGGWHYSVAEPSSVVRTLLRNPMYAPVEAWREVSIHRDGRLLAVGSNDGVSLFDLETGVDVGHLPVGYALHPCFIPATGDLLTYSDQGLFRWPVEFSVPDRSQATIGPPVRLPCAGEVGTEVASDRTGRVVAVAVKTTAVILHESGQRVITLDSLTDCRKVAVSPDGRWVVTASHSDGPIDIWDGDSGAPIRRLCAKLAEWGVCFSPDSELLAFNNFSPRVLRTGTWLEHLVPNAPDIGINCFSPDGQLVIELNYPGATLRELRTGRRLGTLDLPDSPIVSHSMFTPDGRRVVLSSNERHAVYVWDLCQLSRELSDLGLGWNAPSIPLATPAATNRLPVAPLVVNVKSNAD